MIPINTVTFSSDFHLMLLQAHSIEKFVDEPTTHHIYIQDKKIPYDIWHESLSEIYKNHKFVLYESIYDLNYPNANGWIEQQYIKLKLASSMQEEYILSLDSKNILYRPINLTFSFYGQEGGCGDLLDLYTEDAYWIKYWKPWIKYIDIQTGLTSPKQQFPATPYVFNKNHLITMYNSIPIKKFFWDSIDNIIIPSEYLLYGYFATDLKNHSWNVYSLNAIDPNKNFYLHTTDNIDIIFTIYRIDLDSSEDIKRNYRNFLYNCGLDKKYVDPAIEFTSAKNR